MFKRTHRLYYAVLAALGLGLCVAVGLVGCANNCTVLPTAEDVVGLGAVRGDDYCAVQRGRALVVTECTECHRFFWPYEYPASSWPSLMQDMGSKSVLTKRQIGDMTKYMVAASRLTRGSTESSILPMTLDGPIEPEEIRRGQGLAAAKCVGCHRFHQPRAFPTEAWPGIVQSHMDGRTSLTYDEMLAVARYYVHESRPQPPLDLDD